MQFTVADGALALVIALGVFLGAFRGFFAMLSRPVKIIAAICLTFCIASPIITNFTAPYFSELFRVKLESYLISCFPGLAAETAIESLPFYLRIVARLSNINPSGVAAEELLPFLAESLANAMGTFIAFAVTYLGLFIVISLVVGILISSLNKLVSIGLIGVINRILGLILGGVISIALCCIIASLISLLSPEFTGGFVYTLFKDFNPLQLIQSINT